jgi:ANTAR domain
MERGSGGSEPAGRNSSQAARLEVDAQAEPREEAQGQRQAIPEQVQRSRSRRESLHEALEAARAENRAQTERLQEAMAQLQAIAEWIETGRPQREVLRESAFARMQARLESLPVIEQAKGIVMAQQRCGPEEAFDLLRRASQRANVKVHVLAAQIVDRVASPPAETTPQLIRPAASRHS